MVTPPKVARLFGEHSYWLYAILANLVKDRDCQSDNLLADVFNRLDTIPST